MYSLSVVLVCLNVLVFVVVEGTCDDKVGKPLYLTPLLEKNKILEAQEKSRVTPGIANTTSYSGYFTVNQSCESNLFFWLFPAENQWENAPVLLWVEGGPGVSSLATLFPEIGPLTYWNKLGRRKYSWNDKINLLFIDQPVGTGFSFTGKGCYAKTDADAGKQLYFALVQFFQLFPNLRKNKFFVAGHSYGGHFIPALGHVIHNNNPSASVKINLSGFMIGNGWMDAFYQSDVGSYLYQLGLVDDNGRDMYYEKQDQLIQHLKNEEWEKAMDIRSELVGGDLYKKLVGNVRIFNYLLGNNGPPLKMKTYKDFVETPKTRKIIHVGNTSFSIESPKVKEVMGVSRIKSVKPWIEELLNHYFFVFYTGQLDIACGYPMVANFLKALNWSGRDGFKNATRQKWCVGEEQAGYFKGANNLYDVFMRNASHMVALEQPHWAYVLANSVTSSSPDNPLQQLSTC